ncbi:hypothetical protein AB0F36_29455 [Streptomyces sp. NPDC029080]
MLLEIWFTDHRPAAASRHLTACHYPETADTVPAPRLTKDPEAAA